MVTEAGARRPLREQDNLVLIGMPGAGKSTLGVLLAKRTARAFVDTDLLIQIRHGRPLQELLEDAGPLGFRRLEAAVLESLDCRRTVIATGGSAIYSEAAMARLRRDGLIVFLSVPLAEVERRLGNFGERGVVREPGQSLADLHAEREPLYRRHADRIVDCQGLDHDSVVRRVLAQL